MRALEAADPDRQVAQLGLWVFLATEVMLFGGLLTAYTVYRIVYPTGFAAGSRMLDLTLGTVNTIVLIASSGSAALALAAARSKRRALTRLLLVATALLGLAFLGLKAIEYQAHFRDGLVPGLSWHYDGPRVAEVQLFMLAYFALTGLHAVHLTVAVVLVLIVAVLPLRATRIEVLALYWHFVDIIWVFLLPLLYLFGLQS